MAVATVTPGPVDDLGLGAATVSSLTVALVSDATATMLSGVEAYAYSGNESDFFFRASRTLSSFVGTMGLGMYLRNTAVRLSAKEIQAVSSLSVGVTTEIINDN